MSDTFTLWCLHFHSLKHNSCAECLFLHAITTVARCNWVNNIVLFLFVQRLMDFHTTRQPYHGLPQVHGAMVISEE